MLIKPCLSAYYRICLLFSLCDLCGSLRTLRYKNGGIKAVTQRPQGTAKAAMFFWVKHELTYMSNLRENIFAHKGTKERLTGIQKKYCTPVNIFLPVAGL
jgi:hypothetical protein